MGWVRRDRRVVVVEAVEDRVGHGGRRRRGAGTRRSRVGSGASRGPVADRRAFADHLRRLADTAGLTRVIVSHGDIIDREPAAVLRRVADELAPA